MLREVARGRSNDEIATELVISPHTAKTHVNRVMVKLDAHDRAQLVVFAYENGVLEPGSGENVIRPGDPRAPRSPTGPR